MLLLDRKKHGIHFYTVWFAKEPIKKSGIISYREAGFHPQKELNYTTFDTLLTDISGTEEEIKQQFSKSCKYKINRAMREDVEIKILMPEEIEDSHLHQFCDFFVDFWKSKDIEYTQKDVLYRDLCCYRNHGALAMGIAYVHGEIAVYHTHVLGDDWARLLQSASLYRLSKDQEGSLSNIIGMANRNLHYQEMLAFKENGKKIYDWGGAGKEEDVIEITKFKESFGGVETQFYEFEESRGILAHLFKLAVKILKK